MLIGGNIIEAMLNFIPAPVAIVLMLAGFIALAIGGIRLGYKATVKDLALELVKKAELSIMGSGQGAKKKKQVFAAPAWSTLDFILGCLGSAQKSPSALSKPCEPRGVYVGKVEGDFFVYRMVL